METIDSLRPEDQVKVTVYGPDGATFYQSTGAGFRSLESAINNAVENSSLSVNPEDCVFEVTNLQTAVSHRYRINAHGHLKLIV